MIEIKELIEDFLLIKESKDLDFINWRIINTSKEEKINIFVEKIFNKKFKNCENYLLNSYELTKDNNLKVHYQSEGVMYYFLIELY